MVRRLERLVVGAAVAVVVAVVALWQGCFGSVFWITDSFQYMRCAENLKAVVCGGSWCGEWFATWPVGYPAVLAVVSGVTGLDVFVASKVVGVLATLGLLAIFWHYARGVFAILALSLLNLAYLKIYRGTLSEQLFIPLLAWLAFAVHRMMSEARTFRWRDVALLAGLFVGLFSVRYVGALAPVWVMAGWVVWRVGGGDEAEVEGGGGERGGKVEGGGRERGEKVERVGRVIVVAGVIAWGIEAVYLGVNWWQTGYLTGMPRDTLTPEFWSGVREVVVALARELQAFGLAAFWGVVLHVILRVEKRQGRVEEVESGDEAEVEGGGGERGEKVGRLDGLEDWNVERVEKVERVESPSKLPNIQPSIFIGMGVAYGVTMIVLRLCGSCSELGFRFLYSGTLLIAIGCVVVGVKRERLWKWDVRLLTPTLHSNFAWLRMAMLVALVMGIGLSLLDMELWVRRFAGVSCYGRGEPYRVVKARLMERYRGVESGTVLHLGGLGDEDLPIIFLRPDLDFDFPKGARKY